MDITGFWSRHITDKRFQKWIRHCFCNASNSRTMNFSNTISRNPPISINSLPRCKTLNFSVDFAQFQTQLLQVPPCCQRFSLSLWEITNIFHVSSNFYYTKQTVFAKALKVQPSGTYYIYKRLVFQDGKLIIIWGSFSNLPYKEQSVNQCISGQIKISLSNYLLRQNFGCPFHQP